MIKHILGYPSMGARRELKIAIENFWNKRIDSASLEAEGARLRRQNWLIQKDAGLDFVCTGDFSFYDRMLDTTAMLGLIPARFKNLSGDKSTIEDYFKMARGDERLNLPAMEITKWFDTNYHYVVPEISQSASPALLSDKIIFETIDAGEHGFKPKPCLIGPFTYLSLAKSVDGFDKWELLDGICKIYSKVIKALSKISALIQIEEPILCADMDAAALKNFARVYKTFNKDAAGAQILLATYFDAIDANLEAALESECAYLHIDICRGKSTTDEVLKRLPKDMKISAGVVDGRNIWRNDFENSLSALYKIKNTIGIGRMATASSCSLLHSPSDLRLETKLPQKIITCMAFAVQKCREIAVLGEVCEGVKLDEELAKNKAALDAKRADARLKGTQAEERMAGFTPDMAQRKSPYKKRKEAQKWLKLPLLPSTTIGSFPQTAEIRKARNLRKKGEISETEYEVFLKKEIAACVARQEELGLDVLVHGEPERNDMVEYFGEMLNGFCFTENGWVQSYGTRCVKPPVIYADVSRPHPMTLKWINYAASLTKKPMKGMLTGPVTILCWSFVRDDMPRSEICRQIAFAIRDEVADLEKSGVKIIQIDEAALSEGMPIKGKDRSNYLKWAVECFRLATCCVEDSTQIHTHMCYSEFNSIIRDIALMDADVISIEAGRSNMELLKVFEDFDYPNDIGPGVYDIHSPRVPSVEEMANLIRKALKHISAERLWINPDCGLKTRKPEEALPSLKNMMDATYIVRAELDGLH